MADSTIQDFYSLAQQVDFARLHQFRLINWTWNGQQILTDKTTHHVYLETATLPSREITNVPVPYMGMNINVPGLATYSGSANYPVVFRSDSYYVLRQVMEHTTRKIFNDATSIGDYNTPNTSSFITLFTVDKYLRTFGGQGGTPYYTLWGASLINTGQIDYNLGDTGQVAKVNATLTYNYWTNGILNEADANSYPGSMPRQVIRDAIGNSREGGGDIGGGL